VLLKFLEGRTGFDGLMLAGVADEEHLVGGSDALKEGMQVAGTR